MNVWKISTLALAGALAIVVNQGGVRSTTACEGSLPTAEEQTQTRLNAALNFLDRAEMQLKAATAARPQPRAAALTQIALAKAQVLKGLEPEPERRPSKKVADSDKTASLSVGF